MLLSIGFHIFPDIVFNSFHVHYVISLRLQRQLGIVMSFFESAKRALVNYVGDTRGLKAITSRLYPRLYHIFHANSYRRG